ncbi:MAG: NAD-dependent epimerase/dehydratase family protein [Anaerolineae bacterium]|nr:NAD-dependent epimerase/dehydratase family protein [Anaerolineae bacterium]
MSRQPVLVTGATGFLGRNLAPYLVERGHRLRALVRPHTDSAFLEPLGVERAWGDLGEPDSVAAAVSGCRAVVHAAGLFRFWGKRQDFFAVNVAGTHCLLEAAREAGVERFVHISTVAVVGKPPPGRWIGEETACHPQDAYQESKLEAERLALDFYRQYGLPVVILRPGAYYGPWGRYGFNRLFFEDPLKGLAVQVHRGRHVIFPVYIEDVAQAAELALQQGRPGEIYNICGACLSHRAANQVVARLAGRPIRWRDVPGWSMVALSRLWTWLARFTAREPYYPLGLYSYVFYDWRVDSQKARRELGFAPTSFEEGARRTVEWYRSQGIF